MTLARAALLAPAALAACVAPPPSGLRMGDVQAQVDGMGFAVAVSPGTPGAMLTAAGARPVAGATLRVRREGAALAMDEGALAKKAARAGCAAASGRFAEAALGAYDGAGAWVFAGACA